MRRDQGQVRAARTGAASATVGSVANTGIVTGDITVHASPIPRSAYLEQVRQLVPDRLEGRDSELEALTSFCTQDDGPAYAYWRAPAWAGKSALMAWFACHPPPGVKIVPFFVTARFAGHSDRSAFVEIVLEQLLDLLDRPMPALLTGATRDSHLLRTLRDAAEQCQAAGLRLVLLVDGLDEDRGVTAGADAYSIAALLPSQPTAGMRVIVAGREHPHLPDDVPSDHPLRDPAVGLRLPTSPRAVVVRQDMTRELLRLLDGDPIQVSVLGLIAAAGGGLTASDLATLTATESWRIEDMMRSVAGRSFSSRPDPWEGRSHVYVMGHEELHASVVNRIGPSRLAEHRATLHIWAGSFRDSQWPDGCPAYLLRGYFRLLRDTNDIQRMAAYALDADRHYRLSTVTGGDAAAMAEIEAAQTALLQHSPTDLLTMAKLAIHRAVLRERNARLPWRLPALWAAIGQERRAEAHAASIGEPRKRASVFMELIQELFLSGKVYDLQRLAGLADDAIRAIPPSSGSKTDLYATLAALCAAFDQPFARALIEHIPEPAQRAQVLAALAVERCRHEPSPGNIAHAQELCRGLHRTDIAVNQMSRLCALVVAESQIAERILSEAEQLVAESNDSYGKPRALSALIGPAALLGEPELARRLAEEAAHFAAGLPHPRSVAASFRKLAEDSAAAGLRTHAERFLKDADAADKDHQIQTLPETEHHTHAGSSEVFDPFASTRIEQLISSAFVLQRLGAIDTATQFAERIEVLAHETELVIPVRYAEVALALALAKQNESAKVYIDYCQQLSSSLDATSSIQLQTRLLPAMKANGDVDAALALAVQIEEQLRSPSYPHHLASPLLDLADALDKIGESQRSRVLTAEARALSPNLQRVVLRKVSEAFRLIEAAEHGQRHGQPDVSSSILDQVELLATDLDPDSKALLYSWTGHAAAAIGTAPEALRSNRLTALALSCCETWTTPLVAISQHEPILLVEVVAYAHSAHLLPAPGAALE